MLRVCKRDYDFFGLFWLLKILQKEFVNFWALLAAQSTVLEPFWLLKILYRQFSLPVILNTKKINSGWQPERLFRKLGPRQ